MADREIMTVNETAEYLRLNIWTVYRYWRKGLLPGRKIGTRIRFSRRGLEKYLSGFAKQPPKRK